MALNETLPATQTNGSKVKALLNRLPEAEAAVLHTVLVDTSYRLSSISDVLEQEKNDPNRDNGVPAEMYEINERSLRRYRTDANKRTEVDGL